MSDQHVCAEIVPLFQGLEKADLIKISKITRHEEVEKGQTIYSPMKQEKLFILAKGGIKIYQINKNGKEQLLRILQPGDFEGEKTLYGLKNEDIYATAIKSSTVCALNKQDFDKLLLMHPEISAHLLTDFAEKLNKLEKQVRLFNSENIEERIATYLLDLKTAQNSSVVEIPFKMKELATYIGTTPETISRKFKMLENAGLIKKNKNLVQILDRDGLENIF